MLMNIKGLNPAQTGKRNWGADRGRALGKRVTLATDAVRSHWHQDLVATFQPDSAYVAELIDRILAGRPVAPILVVQEAGEYVVVDGHHRLYACLEAGIPEIQAVMIEGDFASTEDLRMADLRLKAYDKGTGYRYGFSAVLKEWTKGAAEGSRATPWQRVRIWALVAGRILAKARRIVVHLAFR